MDCSFKIVFVLIIFFCFSCKKKAVEGECPTCAGNTPPPCSPSTTPITNAQMLLCKYKVGSYWIFKDSLSGSIDTLRVTSLVRSSGFMPPKYQGCDSDEVFISNLTWKHEVSDALKMMRYFLYQDLIYMDNEFIWFSGVQAPPILFRTKAYDPSCKLWDSLLVSNQFYKSVGESVLIEFTTVPRNQNPTTLLSRGLKIFFNAEFGPIQFDLRDRLSKQLVERRQIISRNIVR